MNEPFTSQFNYSFLLLLRMEMEKEARMLLYVEHFLHENMKLEEGDLPPYRIRSI